MKTLIITTESWKFIAAAVALLLKFHFTARLDELSSLSTLPGGLVGKNQVSPLSLVYSSMLICFCSVVKEKKEKRPEVKMQSEKD